MVVNICVYGILTYREGGRSIMQELIKKVRNLYGELVRYLIVGVLTTVVSLGVYYGSVLTFLDPKVAWQLQAANILSWAAAVTFAYIASRVYVFNSKRRDLFREAAAFYSARIATLIMDMVMMFIMVTMCGFNDKLAKLAVQAVVLVGNYVLSKVFVFSKKD